MLMKIKGFVSRKKEIKPAELIKLEEQYYELTNQLSKAKHDMHVAEEIFNQAVPTFMGKDDQTSYIDVAILNHQAAEKRYGLLIKELRLINEQINSFKGRLIC